MQVNDVINNVKVYNLSSGRRLPIWLEARKRRLLQKKNSDMRNTITLIEDFTMPDISTCLSVSNDGQYIFACGTYKPRFRCYEVSALSMKFERGLDTEVIEMLPLSEDYSKMVFLQEQRYLEFHSQGGRLCKLRIPKFGRDLSLRKSTCELFIAASGNEVYRLDLEKGQFLEPFVTNATSTNKCIMNDVHGLLCVGTDDGHVEAWDPRSPTRAATLDCAMYMASDNTPLPFMNQVSPFGITALDFKDSLILGVGTRTGESLIYDIRCNKPLLVKENNDGSAIKDLKFHSSGNVLTMTWNTVNIWDQETAALHTVIDSNKVVLNDLCVVPDTGMIFLATESPKMQTYFVPSLGHAPKWCGYLDALTEEMEEQVPTVYDDYKFVTKEELAELGLENLIGTNILKASMHGYYMNIKLYRKAKQIVTPDSFDLVKEVSKKLDQKPSVKVPENVKNKELYSSLMNDKFLSKKDVNEILNDDRFAEFADDHDFDFDSRSKGCQAYMNKDKIHKRKALQLEIDTQEEKEFAREQRPGLESDTESEAESEDSIVSEFEREKSKIKPQIKKMTHKRPAHKRNFDFMSGDSLSEVKRQKDNLKSIPLEERLATEPVEDEEAHSHTQYGNKEIKIKIKDNSKKDFQDKLKEHKKNRPFKRTTRKIRGDVNMKA